MELALQQGDRFGTVAINGDGVQLVPAGSGARQRDRIHLLLHRLRARGAWPAADALRPVWERVQANDMLVALGDGFDEAGTVLLERLAAARRDVAQLQILTADERDFPFGTATASATRKPVKNCWVMAARSATRTARFAEAQRVLQARLLRGGVAHVVTHTDQPLDAPLRRLAGSAR